MEDNYQQQLRKGMLVLAILQLLSKKEVYVADMLVALEATEFATQEGTLYPLLARLKREGLVEHTWVESPAGPPRKYYSLTKAGKDMLANLTGYTETLKKDIKQLGGKK